MTWQHSLRAANSDTLCSHAWLDLTAGPVELHVSDTGVRYFLIPLMAMWTDVFATIGARTTGTGDQDYVVVGPEVVRVTHARR